MEADRDLLFAVFAVQLKGVLPERIAGAAAAAACREAGAFGERLVDLGTLTKGDREMLDRFVLAAVDLHGGDALKALDAFGGRNRAQRLFAGTMPDSELDHVATVPISQVSFLDETGEMASTMEEVPGRYSQISQYARGGMGRVLLVHDEQIGRNVALKELLPAYEAKEPGQSLSPVQETASLTARFLHEARITGQLEHPSIVPVYEVGRRHDGRMYYTMKLVRGRTLSKAIHECASLPERIRLLTNFVALCQAIAYAHSREFIHRDIKPANVMVGEFGETVVLDWGLAKRQGAEDPHREDARRSLDMCDASGGDAIPKTAYGKALGTPNYMPPEQAEGHLEEVDERSDVYSLGAVLYELLTGQPPFTGDTVRDIIRDVVEKPLPPVVSLAPEAPPELVGICEKCLQKEPAERYASAQDLADDILRFTSGALVRSYEYGLLELAKHYYKKHRLIARTIGVAVAAIAIVIVYSFLRISLARDREHEQRVLAETARETAEYKTYVSGVRLAQMYLDDGHTSQALNTLWDLEESRRNWEWGFLLNECSRESFTVPGTSRRLGKARFAGDYLGIFHYLGPLRILDAYSGEPVVTLGDGSYRPVEFDFSSDGHRIVGSCQDGAARIWDTQGGTQIATLVGHDSSLIRAVFCPDGTKVLTASNDGTARLWDATTGDEMALFRMPSGQMHGVCFSADGACILTGTNEQEATVWDATTGAKLFDVLGTSWRFDPSGAYGVSVQASGCNIWDARDGRQIATLSHTSGRVRDYAISDDGRLLLSGTTEGISKLWRVSPPEELAKIGHGEPLQKVAFLWDPSLVLTCGLRSVKVWDVETQRELLSIPGLEEDIFHASLDEAGMRLVTLHKGGSAKVWDLPHLLRETIAVRHRERACGVDFSPDSGRIASVSSDGKLHILDTDTKALAVCFLAYTQGAGGGLSFSPDGNLVATRQDPFSVLVCDLGQEAVHRILTGHSGAVQDVSFSPTGECVVTASWDNTAKVWDTKSGAELLSLAGHTDTVRQARYSPEGSRIVTASDDGSAIIWNAATGERCFNLTGHTGRVHSAIYHPSGDVIATAGEKGTLIIWDARNGQLRRTMRRAGSIVGGISFSPGGTRILSSSLDRSGKILDFATGEELVTLRRGRSKLGGAVFDASGTRIATASSDGLVRLWQAAPWQRKQLSGRASHSWKDRYALHTRYKRASGESQQGPVGSIEAVPHILVTTRDVLKGRFSRMCDILEQESGANGTGVNTGEIVFASGPLAEAVARLCLLPEDRITHIAGDKIEDSVSAIRALESLLSDLQERSFKGFSLKVARGSEAIPLKVEIVESVQTSREVTLSRDAALAMALWELDTLEKNGDTSLRLSRDYAKRMGEPVGSPKQLNGLWVPGTTTELQKGFYLQLGLAPGDRILRMNGKPVRSMEQVRRLYEEAAEALETDEDYILVYDIERGEFQRLTITVRVQ